jgi:ARC6-like, IMS domain/DnaJ domain
VRIQLDYYRILGVPIQTPTQQLYQAYRDRLIQLPRREYSEVAISARKQLIEQAYEVLSDTEARHSYDVSFLSSDHYAVKSSSDLDREMIDLPQTSFSTLAEVQQPTLEIDDEQFTGALIILHELGEYEQILTLAKPYLTDSSLTVTIDRGVLGDPELVRPDIVLTVAIACLELGREQWQQGQYENAASALETGQNLLLKEGLFAGLRGEFAMDIYKLRPYRVLEILALPPSNTQERKTGLKILQTMLDDRGGIEGTGDDQSGLTVDQFLRFIQQLRGYMTAKEQQTLFEAEARRPSAAATFLAVYALLGRGFGDRQPAYIRQAQLMLNRLSKRQDVHIEQAICAMLLGDTETATFYLLESQDTETIEFIKEHSQGEPDLLPGLCLYGEKWLQTEVFSHFLDLANQTVALTDYFADPQVQNYLENMPSTPETEDEWSVIQPQSVNYAPTPTTLQITSASGIEITTTSTVPYSKSLPENTKVKPSLLHNESVVSNLSNLPSAERISHDSHPSDDEQLSTEANKKRRQRRNKSQSEQPISAEVKTTISLQNLPDDHDSNKQKSHRLHKRNHLKWGRLLLLILVTLGVLSLAIISIGQLFPKPKLQIKLDQPILDLSELEDSPPVRILQNTPPQTNGDINENTAKEIVETWLKTKAESLGKNHAIEKLSEILTDGAFSTWEKQAKSAKQSNDYWEYQHSVTIKSVQKNPKNSNEAKIDAMVNENAKLYENGKINQGDSYQKDLLVRYEVIRKDGQWYIRKMNVL